MCLITVSLYSVIQQDDCACRGVVLYLSECTLVPLEFLVAQSFSIEPKRHQQTIERIVVQCNVTIPCVTLDLKMYLC
jgi:hypothetical protein